MVNLDDALNSNIIVDVKTCTSKVECGVPKSKLQINTNTPGKIQPVNKENTIISQDQITQQTNTTQPNTNDNVTITIKACKNISSKQALLIIPITKYFSKRSLLNKLIAILKGESISLRLIDWFVTNYCKKFNIMYNLNDFRPVTQGQTDEQRKAFDNYILVHTNYKGQLKAYSKRNFDPFCRRNRIRFYYEENKYFVTTVGQLNFFKWAMENHIIDYIQIHLKEIEDDMNLRCENIKKVTTKINPANATSTANGNDDTKKNKVQDGVITVETQVKTKKAGATRKKRKEISASASKSLSIHKLPTTLIFD